MHINWLAYNYDYRDGYGRYATHLAKALLRQHVSLTPILREQLTLPVWMRQLQGIDIKRLTIAVMPPYFLQPLPNQWLITMTEGSDLPYKENWAEYCNLHAKRVIVPCQANADTFRAGGVEVPISVVPGGTDPTEFPFIHRNGVERPYTFLALADRGARKGWTDVWEAFHLAFGLVGDTSNVRIVFKARPHSNPFFEKIAGLKSADPRIRFWLADVPHPADIYRAADCFAIPSRSEGWGMPMREAAMMGLPVIVSQHTGLDDGATEKWAIVCEKTTSERIPDYQEHVSGTWKRVDVPELAEKMRWCYDNQEAAREKGANAAFWLRTNQTWEHAAGKLLELIGECA